jgi:adenosylmethionine-8-amino-7-oxononanoate aminotransferase
MDASIKLAIQYWAEKDPNTKRINFISREGSYHGNTFGALSASGHKARRSLYEKVLMPNFHRVSACNPYRDLKDGQNFSLYNTLKAQELEDKILSLGPETVAAFIAEPVVGAVSEHLLYMSIINYLFVAFGSSALLTVNQARGCVTAPPGYFIAMKAVCDKYGVLLILDEVMSGMGRTGSLHAWEQEHVVPDIQTIGKALGAGYESAAGMLVGEKVANVLKWGTGVFKHGHTYQNHPIVAAVALEVLQIIDDPGLRENVRQQGELLSHLLKKRLSSHANVGDIRGRGLFWAVRQCVHLVQVSITNFLRLSLSRTN